MHDTGLFPFFQSYNIEDAYDQDLFMLILVKMGVFSLKNVRALSAAFRSDSQINDDSFLADSLGLDDARDTDLFDGLDPETFADRIDASFHHIPTTDLIDYMVLAVRRLVGCKLPQDRQGDLDSWAKDHDGMILEMASSNGMCSSTFYDFDSLQKMLLKFLEHGYVDAQFILNPDEDTRMLDHRLAALTPDTAKVSRRLKAVQIRQEDARLNACIPDLGDDVPGIADGWDQMPETPAA